MDRAGLVCQELASQLTSLRVAVVTETYPPEINGVAMTTGRMVDGLVAAGHRVDLIRPRQAHEGGAILSGDGIDGVEEMLSRGIPLPRYANLQMGLPARKVLLRRWSLQRPDVLAFDDLGIRKGLCRLYGWDEVTREQFEDCRARFSPYGTVASLYLWALAAEKTDK